MAEDTPITSDTPEGHVVLGLRIEAALLPEWFEAVRDVASRHVRRMAVVEKPDEWFVRAEIAEDKMPAFQEELAAAWDAFMERSPTAD